MSYYQLIENKKNNTRFNDLTRTDYKYIVCLLNKNKFKLLDYEASFILTNLKHNNSYYNSKTIDNRQYYPVSNKVNLYKNPFNKTFNNSFINPFKITFRKNRNNIIKYKLNLDYTPMIGQIYYNTGEYFEGQVQNGEPNGFGNLKLNNYTIYEGPFINGLPHGNGLVKFSNHYYYYSNFVNGINIDGGVLYTNEYIEEQNIYRKSTKLVGLYETLVNYKSQYKFKFASRKRINCYNSNNRKKRSYQEEEDTSNIPIASNTPNTANTANTANIVNTANKKMRYNSNLNKNSTENPSMFSINNYQNWVNINQNTINKNLKNL